MDGSNPIKEIACVKGLRTQEMQQESLDIR